MTLIDDNATIHRSGDRPRDTLTSYFVRHRFALYSLSGVGIVAGVALNWNWLAAAGLLPILAVLPCMAMMSAMMFMCMKDGTKTPTDPTAEPTRMLPFQPSKALDPQQ
jgi:hypothetical protein